MSNDKMKTALQNPLLQQRKCPGLLGKLFWGIMDNHGVNSASWAHSMLKYVKDPMNVPEQTASRRSEARNNLTSALTGDNPSWLQFLRGLRAARIWRIRITIETWREGDAKSSITQIESTLIDINDEISTYQQVASENAEEDIEG